MPIAVALWSLALKPGEMHAIVPQSDLRITNAALGEELADSTGRTTVKFTYNTPIAIDEDDSDEENTPELSTTVLCSLTPGKIEQSTVDLILEEDEEFVFEVVGKNVVYLTGNYVDQSPPDNVPYNDESEDDEDEEGFRLEDVSSDVEIDPAEIDSDEDEDAERFEEVVEEKSLKRPRESDAADNDGPAKLSKSQEKKLNKKLKAEDGKAVAAGSEPEAKKDGKEKKEKDKKKKEKPAKEAASDSPAKELPSGLKIQDKKIGTGPQAKKGNRVSMRYIGKLEGGAIFDSNTKGKPFTFNLGKGEVIKGWDEGIAGMQAGGERLLIVPPKLGYGNKKMSGIPAGSTLIFECKLVDIK